MMAQKVIDEGIKGHLNEIWGSEVTLWYPDLYAGATDVVGVMMARKVLLTLNKLINQKENG